MLSVEALMFTGFAAPVDLVDSLWGWSRWGEMMCGWCCDGVEGLVGAGDPVQAGDGRGSSAVVRFSAAPPLAEYRGGMRL